MRALVIDPTAKTTTVVNKEWTLKELQEEVGGFIQNASMLPGVLVYVDEEGLLKARGQVPAFTIHRVTVNALIGKAVVLGHDRDAGISEDLREDLIQVLPEFVRFGTLKL